MKIVQIPRSRCVIEFTTTKGEKVKRVFIPTQCPSCLKTLSTVVNQKDKRLIDFEICECGGKLND